MAAFDDHNASQRESVIVGGSTVQINFLNTSEIIEIGDSDDEADMSTNGIPDQEPLPENLPKINDSFSGDIAFETLVCRKQKYKLLTFSLNINIVGLQANKERFYSDSNVKIDAISVMLLATFNETKNEEKFDDRFIYFLLSAILSSEEKKKKTGMKHKIFFAKKIFELRLINAPDAAKRFANFEKYAKPQIANIREMTEKLYN